MDQKCSHSYLNTFRVSNMEFIMSKKLFIVKIYCKNWTIWALIEQFNNIKIR